MGSWHLAWRGHHRFACWLARLSPLGMLASEVITACKAYKCAPSHWGITVGLYSEVITAFVTNLHLALHACWRGYHRCACLHAVSRSYKKVCWVGVRHPLMPLLAPLVFNSMIPLPISYKTLHVSVASVPPHIPNRILCPYEPI